MTNKQAHEGGYIPRVILILIIVVTFIVFYCAYLSFPADKFDILTESFNRIALGISALIAAFFGQYWVNIRIHRDKKIKEYFKKYPHDKFGKNWEIIESENYPGAIYVLDRNNKTKYHILNMKTVYDLGWHIYPRKRITDQEFQSYKVGNTIYTQGEAGE